MVIAVVYIPYVARPIRGQVLSLRRMEFIEAAVASGAGPVKIMLAELLPNVASMALVFLTLIVATNILTEAALSFLGVGVPLLTPQLGQHHRAGLPDDRDRALADDRARARDHDHRGLAERARRCPARRPRPARTPEDPSMMVRLLLGRLAGLVAVLVAISVMVFIIFNVIPGGDPALRLAGRHPTQQNIRQIRHDWGFDQPLYTQYFDMMNHLFISRDLISYQDQTPVLPAIRRGIPRTLSLAIGAALIWLVCGITIGVLSGLHQGRWLDRVLTVVALAGVSIPIFWLGAVLLYLLTYKYHSWPVFSWIPPGGYVPFTQDPAGWATHLFLPWITLAVVSIGFYARVVRNSLLDTRAPGLRAHGQGQGTVAAPRARAAHAAHLPDPRGDAVRARLRRRGRRHRDPDRADLRARGRRPVRPGVGRPPRPASR